MDTKRYKKGIIQILIGAILSALNLLLRDNPLLCRIITVVGIMVLFIGILNMCLGITPINIEDKSEDFKEEK